MYEYEVRQEGLALSKVLEGSTYNVVENSVRQKVRQKSNGVASTNSQNARMLGIPTNIYRQSGIGGSISRFDELTYERELLQQTLKYLVASEVLYMLKELKNTEVDVSNLKTSVENIDMYLRGLRRQRVRITLYKPQDIVGHGLERCSYGLEKLNTNDVEGLYTQYKESGKSSNEFYTMYIKKRYLREHLNNYTINEELEIIDKIFNK